MIQKLLRFTLATRAKHLRTDVNSTITVSLLDRRFATLPRAQLKDLWLGKDLAFHLSRIRSSIPDLRTDTIYVYVHMKANAPFREEFNRDDAISLLQLERESVY